MIHKLVDKFVKLATDPLLKDNKDQKKIEPEITLEMDEIIQDCLHLVILLQRAFQEFYELAGRTGKQLSTNALQELSEIEEGLNSPSLLNYDLEFGSELDSLDHGANMIQMALELTRQPNGEIMPGFEKLNFNVYRWVNELIENLDRLHDQAMSQSTYFEENLSDQPRRMTTQEDLDIDQITEDDIHPDFKQ